MRGGRFSRRSRRTPHPKGRREEPPSPGAGHAAEARESEGRPETTSPRGRGRHGAKGGHGLARCLSKLGIASRTDAARLVAGGRVGVDGRTCRDPERRTDPSRETITLDGRPLTAAEPLHFALHKPAGPVTTLHDPEGRETVFELLPPLEQWVFPIGRLDAETSGLLLFTNDATLADVVAGDRAGLEKRYEATVRGIPSPGALERLARGPEIRLEDGRLYRTRPALVESLAPEGPSRGRLALTISEGKNRQVRRMAEAVGHPVLALRRTRVGPIELGSLAEGSCRALTAAEVEALRREALSRMLPAAPPAASGGEDAEHRAASPRSTG